jgi:hypothetical protein
MLSMLGKYVQSCPVRRLTEMSLQDFSRIYKLGPLPASKSRRHLQTTQQEGTKFEALAKY